MGTMIPFDAATGHGNGGGTSTRVTGEAVMTVMAVMMRLWGSHPRARRFLRTRCVASARRTRSGVYRQVAAGTHRMSHAANTSGSLERSVRTARWR